MTAKPKPDDLPIYQHPQLKDPLVVHYYTRHYSHPIGRLLSDLASARSLSRIVETPQLTARLTALTLLVEQRGLSNNTPPERSQPE